jgi:hypothetical protein
MSISCVVAAYNCSAIDFVVCLNLTIAPVAHGYFAI